MILNLLFPLLLLLGAVESQTANMTKEELIKAEMNQTFSEFTADNSTKKPVNVTSSSYKDERSQIEDELQNNQTSTVITEDDENFQNQETAFQTRHCYRDLLVNASESLCGAAFRAEMMLINTEKWCILEDIIRPYNNMTMCLEWLSNMVGCYYPNPDIQDFFLQIHSQYFLNCSKEELLLVDAPHGLVIVLTLIPVSLIPVLVYLVVWKSKVQK
ncbi:receptor activity-modifying protein 2 [Symphorus nematophorus]